MGQLSAAGRAADTSRGSIYGGLELLRIAESIEGLRTSTVPDSSFFYNRLNGLLDLFTFLLDSDIKMGAICVNDVRLVRATRSFSLSCSTFKALRAWEKRKQSIGKSYKFR